MTTQPLVYPDWLHYPENAKVLRALQFAERAHEGQFRKYTGEPYVTHCLDVVVRLRDLYLKHGLLPPVDMLCAAALHDTVEDTDTSFQEITEEFGKEVAGLVFWLTDITPKEWGNRAVRKRLCAERIAYAPDSAKVIKSCDIGSNTDSIVQHDPKFAAVYVPEKCRILELIGDLSWARLADTVKNPFVAVA